MLKRAKEAPDYVVDDNRGALLNTNSTALDAYWKKRATRRRMSNMSERMDKMEQDVGDIKSLLLQLLERSK